MENKDFVFLPFLGQQLCALSTMIFLGVGCGGEGGCVVKLMKLYIYEKSYQAYSF